MDGKDANGRILKVKEATPKAENLEEETEKVERKPKREYKKK
jgi:hypothetical protein